MQPVSFTAAQHSAFLLLVRAGEVEPAQISASVDLPSRHSDELCSAADGLEHALVGVDAYEAIFMQVPPKVLAEKIVSLSNASKIEFSSFLISRYYLKGASIGGTINNEQKADKKPLNEISAILKKRAKRLRLIDKQMTLAVAEKIDEAVV